ncbi:MAG: tRNA (adenosine(37)-N6)-threonylcarbamoyltransferase complex dimerization subunit type 1 TsaB [bacterium]
MNILGLETSTSVCAVALVREGGIDIEHSITESHIHSEKLLTLIQKVLAEARLPINELTAVAVSKGPGSFTGLRIGMSTAKGLCYALGKPLVLVSTFDAVAASVGLQIDENRHIFVLVDAKQGEFYAGEYTIQNGRVQAEGSAGIIPVRDIPNKIPIDVKSCVVTDRVHTIRDMLGERADVLELQQHCRGAAVARIAQQSVRERAFADIASSEPLYLKEFVVRRQEKSGILH